MTKNLVISAILGGLLVLLGGYILFPGSEGSRGRQATAFDRVMATKTLRCGYVIVAPLLVKDPATGQLSGPIYDIVSQIGETLNLKIDWVEETVYPLQIEGLRTRRFDMSCSHVYLRPNLMPHVEFTQPYYYIPVYAIQRKGETRFRKTENINQPGVTVGAVDGTIPALIAAEDFQKAKLYSLPDHTDYSDNLLAVATRKSDLTFVDPLIFQAFDVHNPGQLEINRSIPPLRTYATLFIVGKGEHDLASMISSATRYLLDNGQIEKIIRSHEPVPGMFFRVAPSHAAN